MLPCYLLSFSISFWSYTLPQTFEVECSRKKKFYLADLTSFIQNSNAYIDLAHSFPDISDKGFLDFTWIIADIIVGHKPSACSLAKWVVWCKIGRTFILVRKNEKLILQFIPIRLRNFKKHHVISL